MALVFGQAQIAVAGTAVQLASNALTVGVTVQALKQNTDQIYVGGSGVGTTHDGTGNGFELQPGQSVTLPDTTDTDVLYINSASALQGICFAGA
jgi:hypothetical protein